jgi:hypothetical protein
MNLRALPILFLLCIAGGLPLACGASPSNCANRLQAIAADVASSVAEKIPLNTQSDCSGASRPPFNDQADTSASDCTPDDTDGACLACLRTECCAVVGESCAGASAAACAATPAVESCIAGALSNPCTAQCQGDP